MKKLNRNRQRVFSLFLLTSVMLLAHRPLLASSVIFKSNFASGVNLTAPYGFSTIGAWQDFVGTDSETGYSWPIKALDANFSGLQSISYDPINPDNFDKYIYNTIQTVTGPKGTPVRELFQTIKIKPVGIGNAQDLLLLRRSHTAGDVTDLYISYWFKLQANLFDQLDDTVSSGNWRSLFEFKTGGYKGTPYGDYRIQTTIMKNGGKLYWLNKGDNRANAPESEIPPADDWVSHNYTVPVPIDTWFKFEVFWHRSTGADGRYWAAVNGQVIVDRFGKNMGVYNNPINRIFIDTTYSGGHPSVDSHMTGLEIWNGFPCGVGVSCYKASIAPQVDRPIQDQAWTESASSNFTLPANTFVDPDGGVMTYSATLATGAALPTWLTFTPGTRTFSGTPPKIVASYNIRVKVTDDKGKTGYDDFILKVNNRPTLNALLPDFVWTENVLATYTFPSTTFSDADGDALTYSANLATGGAIPSWLTFTPSTRTLSGKPPRGVASFNIRVTAKDPYGLSIYDDMIIKINNKPHIGAYVSDQRWNENTLTNYTISVGFFQDIDGDTLTYSATLADGSPLPTWMTFTPSTRTFSGTASRGVASYTIRIKAADPKGLSVTDDFIVKINNKPNVANLLVDQSWKEGIFSSYVIPSNAFADLDGDTLTYRAVLPTGSSIPTWMTFNESTRTLSGTPPVGSANVTIRVWAKDTNYLQTLDDVVINTP